MFLFGLRVAILGSLPTIFFRTKFRGQASQYLGKYLLLLLLSVGAWGTGEALGYLARDGAVCFYLVYALQDDQNVLTSLLYPFRLLPLVHARRHHGRTDLRRGQGCELGDAELRGQISRGEFTPLREWLRAKVHTVGSVYASPDELLTSITGGPVSPRPFLDYLTAKYSELYEL